eukprot:766439-Hanusia_phi.AAC.3
MKMQRSTTSKPDAPKTLSTCTCASRSGRKCTRYELPTNPRGVTGCGVGCGLVHERVRGPHVVCQPGATVMFLRVTDQSLIWLVKSGGARKAQGS